MGRLLAEEGAVEACYHCVTRVVERRFALGDREKERFVEILRAYEEFCGVQVLTFCIMSNHIHVLVHGKHSGNPFTELLTQRCSEWMPACG